MSNVRVTVVSYGNSTLNDILGLEAYAKPGTFVSAALSFGLSVSFEVTGSTWTRLRALLNNLSQRRIPAMDSSGNPLSSGNTQPALTYSMDYVPGDRPRIHQVEGGPLSVGAPTAITVRGTNLLGGLAASYTVQTWSAKYSAGFPGTRTYTKAVDALRIDAVAKGPIGNLISFSIEKATASPSVTVTMGKDGEIYIKVVPLTGASTSTAIAAQIAGSAVASLFVTATDLVAGSLIAPTSEFQPVGPSPGGVTPSQSGQVTKVYLAGGDGGGLAVLDVPVVAGVLTNRLRLVSTKAGNDRNTITLTLLMSQMANAVTVTGNDIVVARTGATETLANLVAAINGNAAAAALVTASAIGAGSLGALAKTWLYGGAGETPVATLAGAVSSITSQTDTAMVITTTAPALATAGALAGEEATLHVQMNYGLVSASLGALVA